MKEVKKVVVRKVIVKQCYYCQDRVEKYYHIDNTIVCCDCYLDALTDQERD